MIFGDDDFCPSDDNYISEDQNLKAPECSNIAKEKQNPKLSISGNSELFENDLFQTFLSIKSRHNVSEEASKEFWNFAISFSEDISKMKEKKKMQNYVTSKRKAVKDLPKITIKVVYKNLITEETITEDNLQEFPKNKLSDTKKYKLLYTMTSVDIEALFTKLSTFSQY